MRKPTFDEMIYPVTAVFLVAWAIVLVSIFR